MTRPLFQLVSALLLGASSLLGSSDALASGPGLVDYSLAEHRLDGRWIYKRNDCTLGDPDWSTAQLFPGAAGPLAGYCIAVFTGSGPLHAPQGLPQNARRDRIALAPMGAISHSDHVQNSHSRTLPLDSLPTLAHPPSRLAILDSVPDGELDAAYFAAASDFSDHGYRLASLTHRLTCENGGSGACAADPVAYLALGYQVDHATGTTHRDPVHGGAIGSQGDLAVRIYDAVEGWRVDHASGDTGPLVINLSLGWHPDSGGTGTPASFDTPVQAVFQALRYASCHGALVVAASGNRGGEVGDPGGPLYPAAWESFPAPTGAQCNAAFGVAGDPIGTASYARLVYGVGAVNDEHYRLGMTRPGSMPTHAAAGSHLAFDNGSAPTPMAPISGTSVATAVVASSAAVVRAYRPDLTAHETMETMRSGADIYGWTTADTPQACVGAADPCDEVHVLSVCQALKAACVGGVGGACGVSVTAAHCNPQAPLHVVTSAVSPVTHAFEPTTAIPACDDGWVDPASSLPDNAWSVCPLEELESPAARPMTLPMPPMDPCVPDCQLIVDPYGNGDDYVDIPVGTDDLSDASVTIWTSGGAKRTAQVGGLDRSTQYTFEGGSGLILPNEVVTSAVLTYVPKGYKKAFSHELIIQK